jgi:SSS family solute:Na+ symporter
MDIAIIIIYLAAIFAMGLWFGRGLKNLEDYSVGGKRYSIFVIFATLSASYIGGGFSIGNAEKVYTIGIVNIVILFGFSLQQFLVAKYIAPRMGKYKNAISVGDIMFEKYGKTAKVFAGIFSFLVCAGILGAQIGGIGYIFHLFLGIERIWGILIGCGIVITYSTVGGIKAVVATDVVQFILLIIAIPVIFILGITRVGGFSELKASLPNEYFSIPGGLNSWTVFISMFLTFFIGETLVPPYVQRLLLSKDAKITTKANLWSSILSVPFFIFSGGIGLIAFVLLPGIDPNLALPATIMEILPVGISGLVAAGIISIVMSSADSFLNSATVSFVNDVLKSFKFFSVDSKKELRIAQLLNLVLGIMAVIVAISITSVLDILAYAYNFWAPIILIPFIAAVLDLKVSPKYFIASATSGLAGSILWRVFNNSSNINNVVIGTIASLIVFSGIYIYENKLKKI